MIPGIIRNGTVEPKEIEDLRAAVGWDRSEGTYKDVLRRHYAYYVARVDDIGLAGYVPVPIHDCATRINKVSTLFEADQETAGFGEFLGAISGQGTLNAGMDVDSLIDRTAAYFPVMRFILDVVCARSM